MSVIDDAGMRWKLGTIQMRVTEMQGLTGAGASNGAGATTLSEIDNAGASELSGFVISTGDEVYDLIDLDAYDIDRAADIWVEILWMCTNAAQVTGVGWQVDVKGVALGEAISDAKVAPDASVAATNQSNVTRDTLTRTVIALPTKNLFTNDRMLMVAITSTADGTAAGDEIRLIGAAIKYTRKACGERREKTSE